MFFILIIIAFQLASAAVNEPCLGDGGRAGVCISTSSCSAAGGASVTGACPADPANIRCCTKAICTKSAQYLDLDQHDQLHVSLLAGGNCRWQSDCAGKSESGLCPGPDQFKCCDSASNGFGGYGDPKEHYGRCQQVAINGAKAIIRAWPKRVREVFCIRDCGSGDSSDHCNGKATDMMCSDGGGVPTMSGREIAEWVMDNRNDLKLKYVIWGQRIWNPDAGDKPKPWTQWRSMDDRGSFTQNHWDHVHVSYK